MAEEYERTNARQWDESLQDTSNTCAFYTTQQYQQTPPPWPREPTPSVQPPRSTQQRVRRGGQRDRQHRPHQSQTNDGWQGSVPFIPRRRRVQVPSDDSDNGRAMAKIAAQTPALRANAEKKWDSDVRREKYRQFPSSIVPFESIGTFHWPSNDYRPDEVFGCKLEALDPIRTRNDCFITSSKDGSTFQVLGSITGVQKALISLRSTCFQIASRNIPAVRRYVSHWRTKPPYLYVHLDTEHVNPRVIAPADETQMRNSKTPRVDGNMLDKSDIEATRLREDCNVESLKATLAEALRKIHYLHGHIQFRIRLGIFVLTSHKYLEQLGVWDLSEYEEMTAMPQFSGRVTEELGDSTAENDALARIQKAKKLLLPHDPMHTELSEVKASYSADFVFKCDAGNLQLTMAWARNEDLAGDGFQLVQSEEKWTRLDRDTGKATDMVDITLTDVHTGSAWQFDIKTSQAVPLGRVPVELQKFSKRVKIVNKQMAELPHITWSHKTSPLSVRVSAVYRYSIKSTDYTMELSNFQFSEIAPRATPVSEATVKLYEPRWAVTVNRTYWDNQFALNERLKVSEKANWNDNFEEWFPAEASLDSVKGIDGFKQLLQKLGEIEKIVRAPV